MLKLKYSIFIFIITILLVSCHKDPIDTFGDEEISTFTAQVYQEIESSIVGYVYDENNQPVENAIVATYSTVTKTNKYGVFVMKNINTDQQGTYIKVIKDGYILGSDFIYPSEGKVAQAYIKLMKLTSDKNFDSKSGGTISMDSGGKIIFPEDGISSLDGMNFTGKVNVTAKYLNPNDKELGNMMPGGLMADAANGNTVVLGTLGMVAVELRDDAGNKLNIKSGSQATIEFPAITDYKPEQINLWSFDENKGRWKEEGTAVLQGDKYVAKVSHFSFWNCDAPFPLIEVCGRVVYEDGTPVKNTTVTVQADGLNTGYGMTNDEGKFCGKMPKGKKLSILVQNFNCNQQLGVVEVGPFENNTLLNDIIINKVPTFIISGKIHCNNNIVDNGILIIKVKEYTFVNLTDAEGRFSIDLTSYTCGESVPVSIFGFDNSSLETSNTEIFTSEPAEDVLLNVCAVDCNFTASFNYNCDDQLTAEVKDGSGNFTYLWDDNTTSRTLTIPADTLGGGIFCVTITDVGANCTKTFCKSVGKIQVGIEGTCDQLNAYTFGDTNPITYLWSNGSTDRSITNLPSGVYCVTVTDANGCSISACEVLEGSPPLLNATPRDCNGPLISFESSPFSFGYYSQPGTNIFGNLTYPISINVLNAGFNFNVELGNGNCNAAYEVKLPQLVDGLSASVVNTTCGTCSDGKINIALNNNATCYQCVIGATIVHDINNLNIDLSAENNAGQLPKGEYYVVVTNESNGCYIAYRKVKIQ
jgi:hypothetical protein